MDDEAYAQAPIEASNSWSRKREGYDGDYRTLSYTYPRGDGIVENGTVGASYFNTWQLERQLSEIRSQLKFELSPEEAENLRQELIRDWKEGVTSTNKVTYNRYIFL